MDSGKYRRYVLTTGVLFGFIAIAHGARLVFQLPATIGNWTTPPWAASFGLIGAGVLCGWAFQILRKSED